MEFSWSIFWSVLAAIVAAQVFDAVGGALIRLVTGAKIESK